MMRSLYSGVSGLKTHQIKMDVIGNNIANVNTVAYKSQSITFTELMYQTTQKASGPNAATGGAGKNAKQIGLGVTSGAINTAITAQGSTQNTGNAFDLKITGESFFVVSNGNPSAMSNRIWLPNTLMVPVPVRSVLVAPSVRMRSRSFKYCCIACFYC